ncbi:MAG: DUF7793 family protein [Bacteroidia bacterium]
MKNSRIGLSFEQRILRVKFLDNAVIDSSDIHDIYAFANERAKGEPYTVIFEAESHYDVTEDALQTMVNNPDNIHVLAKAYVINTKEAERKTRMHLLFDHPSLAPAIFKTQEEGISWLESVLRNISI